MQPHKSLQRQLIVGRERNPRAEGKSPGGTVRCHPSPDRPSPQSEPQQPDQCADADQLRQLYDKEQKTSHEQQFTAWCAQRDATPKSNSSADAPHSRTEGLGEEILERENSTRPTECASGRVSRSISLDHAQWTSNSVLDKEEKQTNKDTSKGGRMHFDASEASRRAW